MTDYPKTEIDPNDYLATLEEVKKQYQQYVEVSKLYELPKEKEDETEPLPPSPEQPLTTNNFG